MADMTLCWDCKCSVERTCDWARSFEPVEGWTAKAVGDSYLVMDCPEFDRDAYGGGQSRQPRK